MGTTVVDLEDRWFSKEWRKLGKQHTERMTDRQRQKRQTDRKTDRKRKREQNRNSLLPFFPFFSLFFLVLFILFFFIFSSQIENFSFLGFYFLIYLFIYCCAFLTGFVLFASSKPFSSVAIPSYSLNFLFFLFSFVVLSVIFSLCPSLLFSPALSSEAPRTPHSPLACLDSGSGQAGDVG
jgi:hypothetical protein